MKKIAGDNCIIIGRDSSAGNCNYCVLIGDNLTADEDHTLKIKLPDIDISIKMTEEESKGVYESLYSAIDRWSKEKLGAVIV